MTRCVNLDRDNDGNTSASDELTTNGVARALGGNEDDVDALGGFDVAEADVETVAEEKGLALGEVRQNVGFIEVTLVLVGSEDDDDVGPFRRLGRRQNGESRRFGFLDRLRVRLQSNNYLDARIAKVLRVCVPL